MANGRSAELTKPGIGIFDDPAAFVVPELPVLATWDNEFDASLSQTFTQPTRVVGSVGDDSFRLLPRSVFDAGDFALGELGFRKRFTEAEPPFWLERSCRPETSLTTSTGLRHRARVARLAMRRAIDPALPTASTGASRSPAKYTCLEKIAMPPRSVKPTECPPNTPGSMPEGVSAFLATFGSSSSGSIDSHCASFNDWNRFLFIEEVLQDPRLTRKSPA